MKKYFGPVLVVIVLLALLEVVSRVILNKVYNRSFDSSLIVDNKFSTSSGLKENATGTVWGKPFHTDEFGCRKSPVPYSPKKKKWLFIGDSVTEGVGVDDSSTFAALVAKEVDSANILNYSLIGYSDWDYLNVLNYVLAKQDTSIGKVTIFFCLNDVYGIKKAADLPQMAKPSLSGKINTLLQDNYATYKLIKLWFYQNSNRYFRFDSQFYYCNSLTFNRAMKYLWRCSNVCKAHRIDMEVVLLPYRSQLNNSDTNSRNPQNMVHDFCAEKGITLYDPLDFCSKYNNPQKLYLFADEIHFSKEGHKTIARYILSH
jgi:lysophospholipase L1-like esterase